MSITNSSDKNECLQQGPNMRLPLFLYILERLGLFYAYQSQVKVNLKSDTQSIFSTSTTNGEMDLEKVSNEEKLRICRKYYYAGFALLPFLWAVNAVWFFKHAFKATEFAEQKQIRYYVIQSMVGSILWLVVLGIWISIYQLNRASWGLLGDQLAFIIPLGSL